FAGGRSPCRIRQSTRRSVYPFKRPRQAQWLPRLTHTYRELAMAEPSDSKVAPITGGSRGLGRSMALHLAEKGTDVIFTYRSQAAAAEAVVREIQDEGRNAVGLRLDVGDIASFVLAVRCVLKAQWGRSDFDFFVNNAGIGM